MERVVWSVRRAGLFSVGLLSVAVGVGTIWAVASPDAIGRVPTWILVAVVGLMVLPLGAAAALLADRRAIAARGVRSAEAEASMSTTVRPGVAALGAESASRGVAHAPGAGGQSEASRHRHQRAAAASAETL